MSTGLSAAQVKMYSDMVTHLFQQKYPRLRQFVQMKTGVRGTMAGFDLLGFSEMAETTGQLDADTPWSNPQNSRRWCPKRDFINATLIGKNEQLEILLDMQSAYARNAAMAWARKADKLIIDAVTATAASGAEGTATSAYLTTVPTTPGGGGGNEIAAAATGMTEAKMQLAREVFNDREVGVDEEDVNGFVMVFTAQQMRELMEDTRTTSRDFYEPLSGRRMPLVDGRIPYYMGFHLRMSRQLNTTTAGARQVIAWHKDAVGFALWEEMDLTIDRLPTKQNATGVQMDAHANAVRIQDAGVLSVACIE